MRLLLIRHAVAVERQEGMADEDRPLTAEGEKRFKRAAEGLARLAPRPDLLFTSPLPRARRTAEIAARAFGRVRVRDVQALAKGDTEALSQELSGHGKKVVALIGHEPYLSSLLASILGSDRSSSFSFRKGGAALVETDSLAGGGQLVFFLPPRLLRRAAR